MAHYAKLDINNIVLEVNVIDNSQETQLGGEEETISWLNDNFNNVGVAGGVTWKKTSYNTVKGIHKLGGTPFRKNYAGAGHTYDSTRDAFIPEKDYPSWILNEDTCRWKAPIDAPDPNPDSDGKFYMWDVDLYQSDNSKGWVEDPRGI